MVWYRNENQQHQVVKAYWLAGRAPGDIGGKLLLVLSGVFKTKLCF